MKKIRVVLVIFVCVLISMSWLSFFRNSTAKEKNYSISVAEGDNFAAEKLFQKAIASYEKALAIKESSAIRDKLLDTYLLAFEDNTISRTQYVSVLEKACSMYPQNEDYCEQLMTIQLDAMNYRAAYSVLKKAISRGMEGERFDELKTKIQYSFELSTRPYFAHILSPNGYSAVQDSTSWGVLGPTGDYVYDSDYVYAGPVSQGQDYVLKNSVDCRVVNSAAVVQAYVDGEYSAVRAFGNDLLPVKTEAGWQYYDTSKKQLLDRVYEEASSFLDGIAAIKPSRDDRWMLIGVNFEPISEARFDNIKLFESGDYQYKGYMIAEIGGSYGLYDGKGNSCNTFRAPEMDLYYGGDIAFKDSNGLWGFADTKGNITIEPQYPEAKSFSSGLAAVSDGEKWGFVNTKNKSVIPYQFFEVEYFTSEGCCLVDSTGGYFHLIKRRFKGEL